MTFTPRYIYSYESGNYSYNHESDKPLSAMEVAELALKKLAEDNLPNIGIAIIGIVQGSDYKDDVVVSNAIVLDNIGMTEFANKLREFEKTGLG